MPIKTFEISGIGPIKFVKAENLPQIVIIAGPNGVGKSTLLEALRKRQGRIEGTGKFLYISPHRAPVRFDLHKNLPIIGPQARYTDILASDSFVLSVPGISLPPFITFLTPRDRLSPDFAPYFEVKYKLGQFQREFELTVFEAFKRMGEIPKNYLSRDIYTPLKELVSKLLPGIIFEKITIEGENYKVYFKNRMNRLVEFDYLSSGEKDIIAILFPFIELEIENELAKAKGEKITYEDLVVLIDTPEAYLHPTLQRALLEYIRNLIRNRVEQKLQFIIATHSTTIISEARPEELYVMVFPDQSREVNQLIKVTTTKEKKDLIINVLGDLGLIALFSGKPLIILEGPTDVELLKILYPEIEFQFTLIPLYGKGKILKLTEDFKLLIKELRERDFKIFAILDKDNQQLEEIKEEWCFVWPRACIENFLLDDPNAIFEALKVKIGETRLKEKGIEKPEDIEKMIYDIISSQETIHEEIKRRITPQLRFIIANDWRSSSELEEKAKNIFITKMERIKKQIDSLSKDLLLIAKNKEKAIREFNGKVIMGKIASKLGIDRNELSREIADKIRSSGKRPEEISRIIKQIEILAFPEKRDTL
jgi:predicted ATP-dependent endonuclease of OLD family